MIPETPSGASAEIWSTKPTPREHEESEPMKRPDRTELLVMAAIAAVAILLI
jgi:hypothetical protein